MYMITFQKEFTLEPKARGFHLITSEIQREIPELEQIGNGIAHIFICHTSAALTLNENADPSVRRDFESHFNRMVPEETSMYEHTIEGSDDMTSHIKSSLLGHSLLMEMPMLRFAGISKVTSTGSYRRRPRYMSIL